MFDASQQFEFGQGLFFVLISDFRVNLAIALHESVNPMQDVTTPVESTASLGFTDGDPLKSRHK